MQGRGVGLTRSKKWRSTRIWVNRLGQRLTEKEKDKRDVPAFQHASTATLLMLRRRLRVLRGVGRRITLLRISLLGRVSRRRISLRGIPRWRICVLGISVWRITCSHKTHKETEIRSQSQIPQTSKQKLKKKNRQNPQIHIETKAEFTNN